MSRTYKDKPYRLKHENRDQDTIRVPYTKVYECWATKELVDIDTCMYLQVPTTKPKQHKTKDTEDHWMTTPGWWIRLAMSKPQRRAGSVWERNVFKTAVEEIDLLDTPSISRKPHQYYW